MDKDEDGVAYVPIDWPIAANRPRIALVKDPFQNYWPKYERFLNYNGLAFAFLSAHQSTWLREATDYDIIIWPPGCPPAYLDEARRKIHLLQHYHGKLCYPDFDTIMIYEDKILQYEILHEQGLPIIPTFISHDLEEVLARITALEYPVVSKIVAGYGSRGVELLPGPGEAESVAREVFSERGRATFWSYVRQKDYVFFQKFIKNEGYDLRVIAIGDHAFGYYRDPRPGDFRASGAGLWRKGAIPEDALRLARGVAKGLDFIMIAVDMLRCSEDGSLYIIEIVPYIGDIRTPEHLKVDGRPGVYECVNGADFIFKEGRFWVQEVALKEFLERKWLKRTPRLL